jgi:hypothetical protein
MKRVIERCPNCGVEHDDPKGGACEVCGTQLRYWCRLHGKEIGFLDSPACPRCAAEAARPTPPPRAPAPPPPPPRPREVPPAPPPRRPAPTRVEPEEVPPWAAEAPPRRRTRPSWGGRDPGVVIREGAEDLAPYASAGATFAVRLMLAFFAVVRSVIGWGLLGALIGFFYASSMGGQLDPIYTAAFGVMVGGGVGLLFGAIRALRILFAPPPDR